MSSKSSKPSHTDPPADFVIVGRIRKPHGVRGEVAVEVLSDFDRRFAVGAEVDLVGPGANRQRVRVVAARRSDDDAIVRFEGYDSRDDADPLRGAMLEVGRDEVPPAPSGAYYYFELIGCTCFDTIQGELGRVERVLEDGGGLILELEADQKKLLVPFVEAYLKRLNSAERRIDFELPEGLIETCTSRF